MGLFLKYFKNLALIMLIGKSLANVTISVGDVSVSGYTEDIVVPVTLSNPENIVGGFQFDVIVLPTLIELQELLQLMQIILVQTTIFLMMDQVE